MLVDEERSLNIVYLAILLDKVFTNGMDIVNYHKLQLLFVSSGRQVQEELVVLINIVSVGDLYTLMDQSLLYTITFGQKVVYNKSERSE